MHVEDGPERRGPIYDDAMKILADDDLDAVLSVIGLPAGAQPMDTALPGSEIRVDLLARTQTGIVHLEYLKDRSPGFDLRMMTYRLRIRGREGDRDTPISQFVLVLGDKVTVPDAYRDVDSDAVFSWTVVRLAELDPAGLLGNPTTAALAALARGSESERAQVLVEAAEQIAATDPVRARTLWEATATLASIVLPRPIITTALKEATMPVLIRDTPLGREIFDEGRQEGRQEAVRQLTLLMLRQRFGDDPRVAEAADQLAGLPDEERIARIGAAGELEDLTDPAH